MARQRTIGFALAAAAIVALGSCSDDATLPSAPSAPSTAADPALTGAQQDLADDPVALARPVPGFGGCRVVRLWRVLRSTTDGRVNWAGLAVDLGYSDQSHLVTEFRSLTGLTPGRWIASRRAGSKSSSRGGVGSLATVGCGRQARP
jgi:AraC-like DNA-binding protein